MTYCGEITVPRVCLERGLGLARMVPMNVWGLGAWRLSVSLCSRASVWVPVARNWHYLAWPHSSITEEDQLALNAGWLKSCPLLDKSGQKWILAGDGLSAFDPSATFATRDSGQKPTSCRIRYLVAPASKGRNKRLRSEAD